MTSTAASARPGKLLFLWAQFGPYHVDRCEAVAEAYAGSTEVIGVEIASASRHYDWPPTGEGRAFRKHVLFPGQAWENTSFLQRLRVLLRNVPALGDRDYFLCHYILPEIFLLAVWLRLRGRRVHTMFDSKFDDRPRRLWLELAKSFLLLPYNGMFVSGARARAYIGFLGRGRAQVVEGYDTVSVARIQRLADAPPAPDGVVFGERHFTVVARFIAKKNLPFVLNAYDLYRRHAGAAARDLILVGSGPLEGELRDDVTRRNLQGVRFAGFLQADGVARALAHSLALILASTEEQWGLVVNEALAMGVPVIVSENVGARDALVREGINGHVITPDNAEGLARVMARLAADEADWRRLCAGATAFATQGDVARFAAGVSTLIGIPEGGKAL